MRLLTKISYYHFWLSAFVLGLTGFMLFSFLRSEISKEIEEQLELQLEMVAEEIDAGRPVHFPLVQITEGNSGMMKLPKIFKDTLIYDKIQQVSEGYYQYAESKMINGKPYRIQVMTTYIGWDNYSSTISYIFISIACMLIVLGTGVNYFISSRIWKPFLINLKRMKRYSVSSNEELQLAQTDVTEFKEMNAVLTDLAERGRKEFNALKEFTENASHEIQTPLSILKTRLESMSQLQPDLRNAPLLNDAKQAVVRLSKVNKGLLLLAKLENDYFTDKEWIDLQELIQKNFDFVEDLFEHKGVQVKLLLQPKKVFVSAALMENLISNLLSNMLGHSAAGINAVVVLDEKHLIFSNEGEPLAFSASKLFIRFGKGIPGYQGNGLGLSIVKQICAVNQWEIDYNYLEGRHVFKISFV